MLLATPNLNDPAIRSLNQKIKAMEDKQVQAEKRAQEAQAAQEAEILKQVTIDVTQLVDASPDYEMIKETGMQEAVTELIAQTYTKEGVLMDIEEACKQPNLSSHSSPK